MGSRDEILNDPETAQRVALDGRQAQIWTALPGIITQVDLTKGTCTVQPAIGANYIGESGVAQAIQLPVLVDVPIVWPRGGGFAFTFPLAAGDEVLVVFASRCIDAWWQSGGVQRPMEARMHDLSDGFAIPGPSSQPKKLANVSSTEAQLRNTAGTAYIALTPAGGIKLVAPAGVAVDGALSINGAPFMNHTHGGVQPGGGNSGPPNP